MNWRERSYEKELLDEQDVSFRETAQNLKELATVNALLGGHSTTLAGLQPFLKKSYAKPFIIAEIGCGGGDNLRVISKSLKSQNIVHRLVGIDLKEECTTFAHKTNPRLPADWITSDYRTAAWPQGQKPDVIFSSLFCHHFTDEELVEQLHWLRANTRLGFFINDLHRHPAAYYSIKALTRLFSKSHFVKNDGPLSVRRAFRKTEWKRLLAKAGIEKYRIEWRWAFRYLIVVEHDA
jgi:2-polyprenyl-3-methyl-5-hydroxy-6-metoxy-1,4-benzoquinol methylase